LIKVKSAHFGDTRTAGVLIQIRGHAAVKSGWKFLERKAFFTVGATRSASTSFQVFTQPA
jgi:hypothetical protein